MKSANAYILLLCLFFSDGALALRCGHSLVDIGDYKGEVYDKCGEPESVSRRIERRGIRRNVHTDQYFPNGRRIYPRSALGFEQEHYAEIEILVEEWIYNFGSSRFQQYLRFENGRLKEIKNLGRGH